MFFNYFRLSPFFLKTVIASISTSCLLAYTASAGVIEDVDRMHNLIAGVPPSAEVQQAMIQSINAGDAFGAALMATEHRAFYDRVLLDWVSPWTNEAQERFAPLNDFSATVIGMIRDDKDFRTVLYDDILYVGTPEQISRQYIAANTGTAYSNTFKPNAVDAIYYRELAREPQGLKTLLKEIKQSELYPLPPEATAGVMTSQTSGLAFFKDGTNRTPSRFFQMNFLCLDMEQLSDVTRPTTYIRQDVDRTPGEKAESFLTECAGCHSGMDALAGAFAYYDRIYVNNQPVINEPTYTQNRYDRLHYSTKQVMPKFFINHLNFPDGFVTEDDSWVNLWREGRNAALGWSPELPGRGKGAKSMGMELAHSEQFAYCQAKKTYELVCLKNHGANSRDSAIKNVMDTFKNSGYNMRHAFAEAALQCVAAGE